MMGPLLQKFRAVSREPYERLVYWKRSSGRKIVGCLPMYIPEEMVHASGMLPVVILDGEEGPITRANEHMQVNTCEQVRGALDIALKGKLDCLDGVVISDVCDPLQYLVGIWKAAYPATHLMVLDIPHKLDRTGREFLLTVLQKFKADLEEISGNRISDQALLESSKTYNESRTLLRRLYELRRNRPGLLSAADMVTIVSSAMLMPKEEHSSWLVELLSATESETVPVVGQVKLMLAGNLCDPPHDDVLGLVESLGAVVVDDEMYGGFRYFAHDVGLEGDPLEALADHYINMVPCTSMHYPALFPPGSNSGAADYASFLIDRFRQSGAQGMVILLPLYCDPYAFKFPSISERLSAAKVPYLMVETEHEMRSLEQVKTRLQAFLEMVRGV